MQQTSGCGDALFAALAVSEAPCKQADLADCKAVLRVPTAHAGHLRADRLHCNFQITLVALDEAAVGSHRTPNSKLHKSNPAQAP